ncbi:MAG TPA: hypothetical protein VK841_06305, partial [Polyangiaceae bacterium]|nr:hypothetical protein [Polyangiaceae bacterium]
RLDVLGSAFHVARCAHGVQSGPRRATTIALTVPRGAPDGTMTDVGVRSAALHGATARRRADAEPRRHIHEVREGLGVHLAHRAPTVRLDRDFNDSELAVLTMPIGSAAS